MKQDFKHILKTQGPKGLYKGAFSTLLRESPGSGLLFMFKDRFERLFRVEQEQVHSRMIAKKIMAAGLAGVFAW